MGVSPAVQPVFRLINRLPGGGFGHMGIKSEILKGALFRDQGAALEDGGHAIVGIHIRPAAMQSGTRGDFHRIAGFKKPAVQFRGDLKGEGVKSLTRTRMGSRAPFGKGRGEFKAIPSHGAGFGNLESTVLRTEFIEGQLLDFMNRLPHGVHDLEMVPFTGGGRHKGIVVLVPDIELVLNRIPGTVYALGRGSPGVHVVVAVSHVRPEGISACPVGIHPERSVQGKDCHVVFFLNPPKEVRLFDVIGIPAPSGKGSMLSRSRQHGDPLSIGCAMGQRGGGIGAGPPRYPGRGSHGPLQPVLPVARSVTHKRVLK